MNTREYFSLHFPRLSDIMLICWRKAKAFRCAAKRRSKTARLFCHIILVMSIGRMILYIIRCQTISLAAKSIKDLIDFAIR